MILKADGFVPQYSEIQLRLKWNSETLVTIMKRKLSIWTCDERQDILSGSKKNTQGYIS